MVFSTPIAGITWYLSFLLPQLCLLLQIPHKTWIHNLDYDDPPPHVVPAHSHSAPPCLVFPVCSVFLYVPSTLICPATVLCTPSEPNDSALSIIPLAMFPAVPTSTRGFPGVRKLKGTFFRNKLKCSVLSCACSEWVLAIHVCVSNYFSFAAL